MANTILSAPLKKAQLNKLKLSNKDLLLKEIIDTGNLESERDKIRFFTTARALWLQHCSITHKIVPFKSIVKLLHMLSLKGGNVAPQYITPVKSIEDDMKELVKEQGFEYSGHRKLTEKPSLKDITFETNSGLLINENVLNELIDRLNILKTGKEAYLIDTTTDGVTFLYTTDGKYSKITDAYAYISKIKLEYINLRNSICSFFESINPNNTSKFIYLDDAETFLEKLNKTRILLERVHEYDGMFPYAKELDFLLELEKEFKSKEIMKRYIKEVDYFSRLRFSRKD